jgi:hypothetical protein
MEATSKLIMATIINKADTVIQIISELRYFADILDAELNKGKLPFVTMDKSEEVMPYHKKEVTIEVRILLENLE